ncbi:MAG: type I methionyl aminopeptidase [Puniceicoccales bacterium]|nr:type I methionyl aminopeptidase [Puniceicoccales bacterium]
MISIKKDSDIEKMRRAGCIAADILDVVCAAVKVGVSTLALEQLTVAELDRHGATGPCYDYPGTSCPFPAHICVSINEEIVHGIPRKDRFIGEGDLVSLDLVVCRDGFMADSTRTVAIGEISAGKKKLLRITERALHAGIEKAIAGNRVGDISYAIEKCARKGKLGIVRELVGHGIGRDMHEAPSIPNWGERGEGERLVPGMTIAIEPMFMLGAEDIRVADDGWTISTADGECAAHFEHTVLITKKSPEILTTNKMSFLLRARDNA